MFSHDNFAGPMSIRKNYYFNARSSIIFWWAKMQRSATIARSWTMFERAISLHRVATNDLRKASCVALKVIALWQLMNGSSVGLRTRMALSFSYRRQWFRTRRDRLVLQHANATRAESYAIASFLFIQYAARLIIPIDFCAWIARAS